MKRKELHIAIDETLSDLLDVVSNFNQEQFNMAPDKDSWTPGEIAQHLVLSLSGFVELMNGRKPRWVVNGDIYNSPQLRAKLAS